MEGTAASAVDLHGFIVLEGDASVVSVHGDWRKVGAYGGGKLYTSASRGVRSTSGEEDTEHYFSKIFWDLTITSKAEVELGYFT